MQRLTLHAGALPQLPRTLTHQKSGLLSCAVQAYNRLEEWITGSVIRVRVCTIADNPLKST